MKRKKFIKNGLLLVFLFITFFNIKVEAASFKYSDFDWDEFAKKNNNFWVSSCKTSNDENCVDRVLATKKKFYTQLYKLLAKVQVKYPNQPIIDDNIIIATVFYGLDSDSFKDPADGESNPYNLDSDDEDSSYLGEVDDSESAKKYFENETNSLKTLINSFIGYNSICYSETDEVPSENTCSSGNDIINGKCVIIINDTLQSNLWDKLKLNFSDQSALNRCNKLASEKGLSNSQVITSKKEEINESYYWDFLESSEYLDNKIHLQEYYIPVLAQTKYKTMKELENDKDTYEKYKEEIRDVRKRIIIGIKEVIHNYKGISDNYNLLSSTGYWWPIGGSEITDENGVLFSKGDPTNTIVTSDYGTRTDPVSGNKSSMHRGVDIGGEEGITSVIAAQDGLVIASAEGITGTCSSGDINCGGGYGNYIIIQHTDGNYTLYAHMFTNSVKVKEGDFVKQGQVIGYVGNTGKSTGAHLHFEIRLGSNSSENTVDPLKYVNSTNPRISAGSVSLVNGDGNQQTVCLTLKSSGMSDNGVAGLMTNINAESGFNPNIIGDNGTSYGLCQWHNGRWSNLKSSFPNNWKSVDAQIQFLFNELHSGYSSLYNSLVTGSSGASSLAYDFCYYFERPANKNQTCSNRASNSSQFFTYVSNGCK